MFGLIPMVITIILAGLITASVAYFGGDIFTSSSIHAKSNTIINEGGQVRNAAQLYRTMNRAWPNYTQLTSTTKYLSSDPQFTFVINTSSGLVEALPASNTGDQAITADICTKIQAEAQGTSDGVVPGSIANQADAITSDQLFGCYGGNTFFHR